jgi:pSer/pThr/pTyr-binding forkhead associated (FHA) protein
VTTQPEKSATPFPENAYLIVNSRIFPLDQETIAVGRDLENNLVLNESGVSRNHARIAAENGHYYLRDLNSTNGTTVNGLPVERKRLQSGDIVSFGEVTTLYVEYATELLLKALDRTGFPMLDGTE